MQGFQYVLGGFGAVLTVVLGYANTAGPLAMAGWGATKMLKLVLAFGADFAVVVTLWSAMEMHRHRQTIWVFVMIAFWAGASYFEVTGSHHWLVSQSQASGAPAAVADEAARLAADQLATERANLTAINAALLTERRETKLEDLRRSKRDSEKRIGELSGKSSLAGIVSTSDQWEGNELPVAIALWLASQVFWAASMVDLESRQRRVGDPVVLDITPREPAPTRQQAGNEAGQFHPLARREIVPHQVSLSFTGQGVFFPTPMQVKPPEIAGEIQAEISALKVKSQVKFAHPETARIADEPLSEISVKAIENARDFSEIGGASEISVKAIDVSRDSTEIDGLNFMGGQPEISLSAVTSYAAIQSAISGGKNALDAGANFSPRPGEIADTQTEIAEPTDDGLKAEITKMLRDNVLQKSIAERLGISQSKVSRVASRIKAEQKAMAGKGSPRRG